MKRNRFTFTAALAAALMLFAACQDDKIGSVYQIFDDNPASKMLEKDPNCSEWVKVLRYADLYNALNQATQAFTVLVPDNKAMADFYEDKKVAGIEDLGVEYARALIFHHTMLDSIQVDQMQLKTSLTNLGGDAVSVEIDSVNAGQFIFGGVARTVESGVHAYNALIYYIDAVMTPLVESVTQRMEQAGGFSIMMAAIKATGWDKELDVIYDTIPQEGGGQLISRRTYTLLAVSDRTFAEDGISDLQSLAAKLGAASDYTSSANALNEYVAYHILESACTLAQLREMPGSDTTRIWSTLAQNQVFMVTADTLSGKWMLNALDANISETHFLEEGADILCKNGYLQQLDGWMPVWEPTPTTVVWDLGDYASVRTVVLEAGVEYQPAAPVSSETTVAIQKSGAYEYEVSEAGVAGTAYPYVSYRTCKKQLADCEKNDRVIFNLGYMGSAAMKTPTIVRGKYRVDLKFVYLSDHSFMRTMSDGNGGMIRMSFDGENEKSAAPYTTVTKTTMCVCTATLYDSIEFEMTANHVFKFVVMDPTASTNSKFSLQFDSLIFTPIE